MTELPLAVVKRLMKKAGAKRVSKTAANELINIFENQMLEVTREATKLAEYAGRRTVRDSDVRLAVKRNINNQ